MEALDLQPTAYVENLPCPPGSARSGTPQFPPHTLGGPMNEIIGGSYTDLRRSPASRSD